MKRKTFKKKYDFNCPGCDKKLWAAPSMMMTELGNNSGHGSCPDCNEFFHLEIEGGIDGEIMIAKNWDSWLKVHQRLNKIK